MDAGNKLSLSIVVVEEEGVVDLDAVRQAVLPLLSSTHLLFARQIQIHSQVSNSLSNLDLT